ncbi:MAG: bifunctional riboflavin kinase/FAD synthetase [Gammaproteobacteria bacterium]|jgi:riboflavin kinase/FMN adenylyltransferase
MQLIRGLHNLRPHHRGCVATIGNFDGVHLGHRAVFEALLARGRELGVPAVVVVFEPQPLEFFRPADAPARLTRLREKLQALEGCGIHRVLLLEFNRFLADMSAGDFIDRVMVDGLGVRHLYVGDDFRFGRGRSGGFETLVQAGHDHGFGVASLNTVAHMDQRISSTRIRDALAAGELEEAAACLGRPYRICGRVAHGDKRGRTIGFPTMNVDLHRRVSPLRGVYAVRVEGLDAAALPGVANIGTRPTVAGDTRYLLEVHLFDFARQVYGAHVGVEFVRRIREERKFDSFEQLRRQIRVDAASARDILGVDGSVSRDGATGSHAG